MNQFLVKSGRSESVGLQITVGPIEGGPLRPSQLLENVDFQEQYLKVHNVFPA